MLDRCVRLSSKHYAERAVAPKLVRRSHPRELLRPRGLTRYDARSDHS